jgi:16S rRNA (uracil1498-N3)-methyltransferase
MDLIVQKAVELGVAAIQPLVTRNTIVQPGDGKSEKWRRNALEACKQCGQDTLPRVEEPLTFERWISAASSALDLKIIASLAHGARPLREVLHAHLGTRAVTLLIGPEGDFTAEETVAALDAGFLPVSLGEIVLRVETATLFCISALRYEFSA